MQRQGRKIFIFMESSLLKTLVLKHEAWIRRFPCSGRTYLLLEIPIQSDRLLKYSVASIPDYCESLDINSWAWLCR